MVFSHQTMSFNKWFSNRNSKSAIDLSRQYLLSQTYVSGLDSSSLTSDSVPSQLALLGLLRFAPAGVHLLEPRQWLSSSALLRPPGRLPRLVFIPHLRPLGRLQRPVLVPHLQPRKPLNVAQNHFTYQVSSW